MGRRKKQIDEAKLLEMRASGKKLEEISKALGVSVPTISRRIAVLQYDKGILTKYRQLQGLQLTELQARILETADSKNLDNASLIELLKAFNVLKRAEKSIQGKERFKIHGLLAHLQVLEKMTE